MKSKVRIALIAGVLFNKNEGLGTDGKQYGFYRVEQSIVDQSSGVDSVKLVSALRSIREDDFNKAKDFLVEGLELPGTIQTLESMTQEKGFQAKTAGDGGPACTVKGAPIYMSRVYNANPLAADVLIAHDNTAEIKAWQASKVEAKGINAK